jgi:hypothetical protein
VPWRLLLLLLPLPLQLPLPALLLRQLQETAGLQMLPVLVSLGWGWSAGQ